MSFLETLPGALDEAADPIAVLGPWAPFRVTDIGRRLALLRELSGGSLPITLGHPGGAAAPATLWSVDAERNRLHFNADPSVAAVLAIPGTVWAAAYLGEVKLQFPLPRLRPAVGGMAEGRVECELPEVMIRLARRQGVRLRRTVTEALKVRLAHPLTPDRMVDLPVQDISLGGCALWRTREQLPLVPGMQLMGVEFIEGRETVFFADLQICHVSADPTQPQGVRVGCTWAAMAEGARSLLQRWVTNGERRRGRYTLSLDLSDMTLPLRPLRSF